MHFPSPAPDEFSMSVSEWLDWSLDVLIGVKQLIQSMGIQPAQSAAHMMRWYGSHRMKTLKHM